MAWSGLSLQRTEHSERDRAAISSFIDFSEASFEARRPREETDLLGSVVYRPMVFRRNEAGWLSSSPEGRELGRTGCAIAGSRRSCTQARPRGRKRTRWQATKRYQASVDAVDRIIAFVAADRTGGTEDTIRGEARRKAGRTAVGLS
jgi:hypothetical protein